MVQNRINDNGNEREERSTRDTRRRRRGRRVGGPSPPRQYYFPPRPNFMKMSSLPLLRMSPPGAVISVNFCMRFGWVVGGACATAAASGCAAGAGTTAGPARRAGDGADVCGVVTPAPTPTLVPTPMPAEPGDCTAPGGVLALPALVRAIVLAGWPIAAPLALACHHPILNLLHMLVILKIIINNIGSVMRAEPNIKKKIDAI